MIMFILIPNHVQGNGKGQGRNCEHALLKRTQIYLTKQAKGTYTVLYKPITLQSISK